MAQEKAWHFIENSEDLDVVSLVLENVVPTRVDVLDLIGNLASVVTDKIDNEDEDFDVKTVKDVYLEKRPSMAEGLYVLVKNISIT